MYVFVLLLLLFSIVLLLLSSLFIVLMVDSGFAYGKNRRTRKALGLSLRSEQPKQNWSGRGEADCLLQTKHRGGLRSSAWCALGPPVELSPTLQAALLAEEI